MISVSLDRSVLHNCVHIPTLIVINCKCTSHQLSATCSFKFITGWTHKNRNEIILKQTMLADKVDHVLYYKPIVTNMRVTHYHISVVDSKHFYLDSHILLFYSVLVM